MLQFAGRGRISIDSRGHERRQGRQQQRRKSATQGSLFAQAAPCRLLRRRASHPRRRNGQGSGGRQKGRLPASEPRGRRPPRRRLRRRRLPVPRRRPHCGATRGPLPLLRRLPQAHVRANQSAQSRARRQPRRAHVPVLRRRRHSPDVCSRRPQGWEARPFGNQGVQRRGRPPRGRRAAVQRQHADNEGNREGASHDPGGRSERQGRGGNNGLPGSPRGGGGPVQCERRRRLLRLHKRPGRLPGRGLPQGPRPRGLPTSDPTTNSAPPPRPMCSPTTRRSSRPKARKA